MSMNVIESWDEVPLCDNEQAEAAFWEYNRPSLRLMEDSAVPTPGNSDSVSITLRIDPRMLGRIKRIARERYLNYQSMIKQWLSERLEQEQKTR